MVSATFHNPDPIPRLGTHMDTQERVEMWSQVPHNAQKPHCHSCRKLSPDFPRPPIRIKLQVLSVLSFFSSPLKKKNQTKKPQQRCQEVFAQKQEGRTECGRTVTICSQSTSPAQGLSRQQDWGQPGTPLTTRMSPCPRSNQLCWFWWQTKVLCSGKAFPSPSSFP